uniref:Lamina-associated polypeptide 2 alpha C-terminal domain-containing protein n=1 Tax=Pelodiscus sinensis TaxID=13735 RepID=K7EYV2_PELSI
PSSAAPSGSAPISLAPAVTSAPSSPAPRPEAGHASASDSAPLLTPAPGALPAPTPDQQQLTSPAPSHLHPVPGSPVLRARDETSTYRKSLSKTHYRDRSLSPSASPKRRSRYHGYFSPSRIRYSRHDYRDVVYLDAHRSRSRSRSPFCLSRYGSVRRCPCRIYYIQHGSARYSRYPSPSCPEHYCERYHRSYDNHPQRHHSPPSHRGSYICQSPLAEYLPHQSQPLRSPSPTKSPTIQLDQSEPEEGQLSETEDPKTEASPADCPSSSPDEAICPVEISPPDDLKHFQDLFKRVADTQDIQLADVPVKKHRLLKNLRPQQRAKVALPIDEAIMEVADEIWQTPTSVAPTSKKADRKYFVPAKGLDFLFNLPQPNSLVVDAAQRRGKVPQYRNTLLDKDNKKLDVLGRKVYSSATLLLRIANYSAHLSNHNFDNYSKLADLLHHLPDTKKPLLKAIVQEGYASCSAALQIAMNVADTAARAAATGIAMRRSSWLSSAGAPKELQSKVEDLPFDKLKLFAANTDEVLHS